MNKATAATLFKLQPKNPKYPKLDLLFASTTSPSTPLPWPRPLSTAIPEACPQAVGLHRQVFAAGKLPYAHDFSSTPMIYAQSGVGLLELPFYM
jgi:hypothetical protein